MFGVLDPPNQHWFRNRAVLAGLAFLIMSITPPLAYMGMASVIHPDVVLRSIATRSLPILILGFAGVSVAHQIVVRGGTKLAIGLVNATIFAGMFVTIFVGLG